MAVGKVTRNSKESFFGGGKGGLIRFGPNTPRGYEPKPKPEESREQFGAEPEEETEVTDVKKKLDE